LLGADFPDLRTIADRKLIEYAAYVITARSHWSWRRVGLVWKRGLGFRAVVDRLDFRFLLRRRCDRGAAELGGVDASSSGADLNGDFSVDGHESFCAGADLGSQKVGLSLTNGLQCRWTYVMYGRTLFGGLKRPAFGALLRRCSGSAANPRIYAVCGAVIDDVPR
jgi:hypothetical protein